MLRRTSPCAEPLEGRLLLASAVRISDIQSGPTSGLTLQPGEYGTVNNKFFFVAHDGHGLEPWVSDGTPMVGSSYTCSRSIHSRI